MASRSSIHSCESSLSSSGVLACGVGGASDHSSSRLEESTISRVAVKFGRAAVKAAIDGTLVSSPIVGWEHKVPVSEAWESAFAVSGPGFQATFLDFGGSAFGAVAQRRGPRF
eukprot:scaffold212704_cov32-Tisochrysis_lutea.AAC.2